MTFHQALPFVITGGLAVWALVLAVGIAICMDAKRGDEQTIDYTDGYVAHPRQPRNIRPLPVRDDELPTFDWRRAA